MTEQEIAANLDAMFIAIFIAIAVVLIGFGIFMHAANKAQQRRFDEWDKKFPPRRVKP